MCDQEARVSRIVVTEGVDRSVIPTQTDQTDTNLGQHGLVIDVGVDDVPVELPDASSDGLVDTPAEGDYTEQSGRYTHSEWARGQRAEPCKRNCMQDCSHI